MFSQMSVSFALGQDSEPMKAVKVDYYGGISGFDSGGYQLFRAAAGQLVADGTIGTFLTQAIGKSGGGTFCLELSPYYEQSVDQVMKVLASISPADQVTVYRYSAIKSCINPSPRSLDNNNKETEK
jgi:hypothetical protein